MWRDVKTNLDFDEYLELLKASHPVYVGSKLSGLRNIISRPGKLFIFDSANYKILLALSHEDKTGRVINAVPSGNYLISDLDGIAKNLIRKVREVFDVIGMDEFKADVLDDYQDVLLNDLYHKIIPGFMHEYSDGQKRLNGQHPTRGMKFKRLQAKKKDDEKFIGPGV
jgi:hypothetical protein